MPELRLFRTACGSHEPARILADFLNAGEGSVCATDAASLRAVLRHVPDRLADRVTEGFELSGAARIVAALKDLHPPAQASGALAAAAAARACRGIQAPPFDAILDKPGFHRAFVRLWRELTAYGVSEADLLTAAEAGDDEFAAKMESLCSIRAAAKDITDRLNRSLNGDLIRLCIDAESPGTSSFGRWFCFLGPTAAPLDLELLYAIAEAGGEVWAIRDNADELIGEEDGLAAVFGDQAWLASGDSHPLAAAVFRGSVASAGAFQLELRAAPDPLTECEHAVRLAQQTLEEGGTAAIFCRNLESGGPLLSSAADRFGTPLAMPRKVKLLSESVALFFAGIVAALESSDPRNLGKVLRSGYASVGPGELARIRERLATARRGGGWDSLDPAGLPDWLGKTLAWRRDAAAEPASTATWYSRIRDLGARLPWQVGHPGSESVLDARDQRAQNALLRALASDVTIGAFGREDTLTFEQAVLWMTALWERAEVVLPWDPEGILVTDEAAALTGCDHVIAISLVDGVFPRRSTDDPLLNDSERRIISESAGLVVPLPTTASAASDERREFVRLCAAAQRRLTLSYSAFDDERTQRPARFVELALRAYGKADRSGLRRLSFGRPDEAPAVPWEEEMHQTLANEPATSTAIQLQSEDLAHQLRAKATSPWTLGQIRRVASCPFQAFASDVLGIKRSEGHTRHRELYSLPEAARLILIETEEEAIAKLHELLAERIEAWRPVMPPWEAGFLAESGSRLIDGWVSREFAARRQWRKDAADVQAPFEFDSVGPRSSVRGRAAGSYRIEGRLTLVFYRSSAPLASKAVGEDEEGDIGLWDLLLAGLAASGRREITMEIDDAQAQRRRLLSWPRLSAIGESKAGLYVETIDTGDDPEDFSPIQKRAGDLAKRLKAWSSLVNIEPTPGDACRACDYGELCRRHFAYGEQKAEQLHGAGSGRRGGSRT